MNFSGDNIRVEHPLTQPITDIKSMVDREYPLDETASAADELDEHGDDRLDDQTNDQPTDHINDQTGDLPSAEPGESRSLTAADRLAAARRSLEDGVREDATALQERYSLEQVLAIGGSSIVYRAHDKRHDGSAPRYVALKTLRPELRDHANSVERLKREFRYAAAAAHPNTVRMFDLERVGNTWCVTMELLEGDSLATKLYDIQPDCIPNAQALAILKACSRALNAAHLRGVAHCDFKPSNIWVIPVNDSRVDVRLLDFGAAHRYVTKTNGSAAKSQWLTGEPLLPATVTPAYASPQMLTGEPPDPRDDVFSFACVAYEVFTGRHPFGRLNAVEMMTTGRQLVRPIGMSFRRWNALKRGLEWQRELRPPTVPTLMLELDQHPQAPQNTSTLLAHWALKVADWAALKGLLGESRSRNVPQQYIRIGAITQRRLGLTKRGDSRHPQLARIARNVDRFSVAVIHHIVDGVRFTAALLLSTSDATHKRLVALRLPDRLRGLKSNVTRKIFARLAAARLAAKSLPPAETKADALARPEDGRAQIAPRRSSADINTEPTVTMTAAASKVEPPVIPKAQPAPIRAPKAATPKAPRDLRTGRNLIGAGLALLLIACVPFALQKFGRSTPEPLAPQARQTEARSDALLAFAWPRTAIVTAPQNTFGDAGNISPVEYTALAQLNELMQPSRGFLDETAKTAPFAFTFAHAASRMALAKTTPRQAATVAKPSNSVTLAHSRIDVSDQAVAVVLLLKRDGRIQEPVTVRWRTITGTAKPGADYENVETGTARFADNQTVRTLYVPIKQNRFAQGDRSFTVELINPSTGAALGQITRAVITIRKRES